jgi:hypothetical protein
LLKKSPVPEPVSDIRKNLVRQVKKVSAFELPVAHFFNSHKARPAFVFRTGIGCFKQKLCRFVAEFFTAYANKASL